MTHPPAVAEIKDATFKRIQPYVHMLIQRGEDWEAIFKRGWEKTGTLQGAIDYTRNAAYNTGY